MDEAPIFVKIADYKKVMSLVDHIKQQITEAKELVDKLQELKKQEDASFAQWQKTLTEVEKRTQAIDGILYKVH